MSLGTDTCTSLQPPASPREQKDTLLRFLALWSPGQVLRPCFININNGQDLTPTHKLQSAQVPSNSAIAQFPVIHPGHHWHHRDSGPSLGCCPTWLISQAGSVLQAFSRSAWRLLLSGFFLGVVTLCGYQNFHCDPNM